MTEPVSWTSVTASMRPIMAGAASGSSAVWPERVWPFWTTSRLVPRAEISFSRPAEADEESPKTATMAATPMAMPNAERPARSLRVRSPTVARRARSEGRSFLTTSVAVVVMAGVSILDGSPERALRRRRLVGAVEDDPAVEHLDAPAQARRDVPVVGDDHDGHPEVVQVLEEPQDGPSGGLVEVAGRLVGEHDRRAADQGPGDRDPLALPARELVGAGVGSLVEADQSEGVEGTGPPLGLGDPGVEEAVGHVVERALVLGQEELLEDEADPGRPQRSQLPVGEPLDVEAGDPHPAGAGPVQGAHQLQESGLARPRRPDDAHQLAPGDG